MHAFIIDVNAVRQMCTPDSSITSSQVLKHLDYSQADLGKNYRTIIYCENE